MSGNKILFWRVLSHRAKIFTSFYCCPMASLAANLSMMWRRCTKCISILIPLPPKSKQDTNTEQVISPDQKEPITSLQQSNDQNSNQRLDDKGKPYGVHYTKLSSYLIESIKELKKEIDTLKKSKK